MTAKKSFWILEKLVSLLGAIRSLSMRQGLKQFLEQAVCQIGILQIANNEEGPKGSQPKMSCKQGIAEKVTFNSTPESHADKL